MFCNHCGKQVKDNARFCPYCGNSIDADDATEPMPQKKKLKKKQADSKPKKKKGKVIFLLVLVLLLAGSIGGTAYAFTSPAHQLVSRLNKEDYSRVTSIYEAEVKGNAVQMLLANRFLLGGIEDTMEDYGASKVEYETAKSYLETVSALEGLEAADEAAYQMETLETLSASKQAYEAAQAYYEAGDYAAAINAYQNVTEDDAEHYEDAVSQIAKATELYRDQILEKVGTPSTVADYETALELVETAVTVLPEDTELVAKQSELEEAYAELVKSIALSDGTDALTSGDYATAFDLIQTALTVNEDDAELQSLLSSSQDKYETYISDEVAALVSDGSYDDALELVAQALTVLPNSSALKALQSSTEESQPVKLSEMKISDSCNYEQIDSLTITMDVVGNEYNPGNLFKLTKSYNDGSVDYYLNDQYTALTGTLAVSDDSDSVNATTLTIYGDGEKILYTKVLNRTTAPEEISVDLTGVEWLAIRLTGDYKLGALFSEFQLTKSGS